MWIGSAASMFSETYEIECPECEGEKYFTVSNVAECTEEECCGECGRFEVCECCDGEGIIEVNKYDDEDR